MFCPGLSGVAITVQHGNLISHCTIGETPISSCKYESLYKIKILNGVTFLKMRLFNCSTQFKVLKINDHRKMLDFEKGSSPFDSYFHTSLKLFHEDGAVFTLHSDLRESFECFFQLANRKC